MASFWLRFCRWYQCLISLKNKAIYWLIALRLASFCIFWALFPASLARLAVSPNDNINLINKFAFLHLQNF